MHAPARLNRRPKAARAQREASVNCLIALFGLIVPRVAGVYWWLTDTTRWSQVFGSGNVLIPALGILFVPWTTLMYLFFWKPEGIDLFGWVVIVIAFLGDIGTYGGGFLGNRDRVESYYRRDY
jgi:hypothetical protein